MNGTFMFEEDRLRPEEDFWATYQAGGGRLLAADDVSAIILACVGRMSQMYRDQSRIDDFPSVLEVLSAIPDAAVLPVDERRRLADVVARHERGQIPAAYADAIQRLARTHRLGLITNIWAPKDLWLEELARAGLANEFTALVFSSDSRRMKPSRILFAEALRLCRVEGSGPYRDVVCIGDSLRRDVAGAQAVGLRTIWINPTRSLLPFDAPRVDAWVADLRDLVPPDPAHAR
jgi:putative hydrolase of the HAD superfamily/5'-nucleotidase